MSWIDPECLTAFSGTVKRYLPAADGRANGLLLEDGTEVHVPPYLGEAIVAAAPVGTKVSIRGVRPRAVAMLALVSITPAGGATILDEGATDKEAEKERRAANKGSFSRLEFEGTVERPLHGGQGEVRGLLFTDGRVARFPTDVSEQVSGLTRGGETVTVRGPGLTTAFGEVMLVQQVGGEKLALPRIEKAKAARAEKAAAQKAEKIAARQAERERVNAERKAEKQAARKAAKQAERQAAKKG